MLLLSMVVGTFELPVGPGWGTDRVGGAGLLLPTSVDNFWLSVGL